jgi:malonyl CoA-acyl carrier protein transacylase/NAD(P)-dependent dehydrogenase (short-subunit alcohol dehydrogenase family)
LDVAYSLVVTRAALEHRAVVLAADQDGLLAGLASIADGDPAAGVVQGRVTPHAGGRSGVLFAGQGAQRLGMGRELAAVFPVFAEAFEAICARLDPQLGRSLAEVMWAEPGGADAELLDQTMFTQAGLFALEVALFRLMEHWGLAPDFVIGHSIGELAAAHVAGVWSLDDACAVVSARGRLMQTLAPGGAMVAIQAREEELHSGPGLPDGAELAAVNGPTSVVVSGAEPAVEQVAAHWREQGRKTTRLRVSHAFHSQQVEPMLAEFRAVAETVSYHRPTIPLVSNVTGTIARADELCSAEYWVRQVRQTVRFADGIDFLHNEGVSRFVEIGPDATLSALAKACLSQDSTVVTATLRKDHPEPAAVLTAAARLFADGARVAWTTVVGGPDDGRTRVELPTYAFQRQRFWISARRQATDVRTFGGEPLWEAVDRGDLDAVESTLGVKRDVTLAELVPALSTWHKRVRDDAVVRDWTYEVTWTPISEPTHQPEHGTWLALVPQDDDRAATVLRGLATAGMRFVTMECGSGVRREELAKFCADVAVEHDIGGVVSLLALDISPHPDCPAVPAGHASTLQAVQALGDALITAPLWCVTSGAVVTGSADQAVSPEQRMVWGLGRVACLEHPDRWGGLVDLPAALDDTLWPRLAAALTREDGEDQLAVRADRTLARRLRRALAPGGPGWRPRGTVLITGATGGTGEHLARWLAGNGAERLVLVSRRGRQAPGMDELAADLRAEGVDVLIEPCDVADRDQVRDLLGRINATGDLTAVVHAAAVLDDAMIEKLDLAQVENVLRVKALGARILHELTAELELDAFVLYSSFGATVGIPGQGNYAPANAYLDALAEQRRAAGLPATALSFGAWAGAGMAQTSARSVLERYGVAGMAPRLAVQALRRAVGGRACQTIADVRWERFATAVSVVRPSRFLADLPDVQQVERVATEPAVTEGAECALRRRLADLSYPERQRIMLETVLRHTAAVLGYGRGVLPDQQRSFRELGFDSLSGVDLRNRMCAETGLPLPVTLVFEHPTATALAERLLAELDLTDGGVDASAVADSLEAALDVLDPAGLSAAEKARLRGAVRRLDTLLLANPSDAGSGGDSLDDISDDELFQLIDRKFGDATTDDH